MPSAKIHAIGQETVRWSRSINEKGSDRVEAILASASGLAVSVICVPEIVSALYRRRRESKFLLNSTKTPRQRCFRTLTMRRSLA
jgi:hypothetical protein